MLKYLINSLSEEHEYFLCIRWKDYLSIKETVFNNELDFYIYVFSKFENIDFTSKEILSYNIKSPLQIFIDHINSKGYSLNGFVHKDGAYDDDGYSYCAFDLQISDTKNILVQYPQRDGLIFGSYIKLSELKPTDNISYNSDFLSLLESIQDDNLETYIEDNLWE